MSANQIIALRLKNGVQSEGAAQRQPRDPFTPGLVDVWQLEALENRKTLFGS